MVFEKIKSIIVDVVSCDESIITLDSRLKEDLSADSLDAVELILATEEEYNIQIPDEVAMNIKTVREIVDYITANI